ncbi:dephospho-CoA kinase [Paenibacillus sp. J2TS4]|uniref:dephospho-CoA kinase n=1 Tax=Paenibacillus sp. J2TS4 TaxID=2807194 RepID=UPI001B2D94EC|nr:dephospho-CoA kinase [Paenibacillus sp. J2TS4]GIP33737.1 dephospho-CoA kinase [Paenibacillus sp. J2TS4]
MNIGLTGGIASGKSTVATVLVERGALLIDADQIAREVVLPGTPLLAQVAAHFGQAVLNPDGSLNRKKLGEIVFADPAARKDLEGLLHPQIRALMKQRMLEAEAADPHRLVVVDVPLLFESGLQAMFEQVMVVYVSRATQLTRLMARDGLTAEQAQRRLDAQMAIEEKKERADIVIDNEGSLSDTERQIDHFLEGKGL